MKTRIFAIAAAVALLSSQAVFAGNMMDKGHKMPMHSTMMGGKHPAMGLKMMHGKMYHGKMTHNRMMRAKMMHEKMMHDKMAHGKMMHGKMGHM